MKLIALALLLATTAEAQRAYPLALPRGCRDRSCVRGRVAQSPNAGGGSTVFVFSLAPANSAGMGSACACSSITGSAGEAVTLTRASSAYCDKGNTLASIANGDLVQCPSNQPRVMPGGDGSGVLGLLSEQAATQYIQQTRDLTNVAWTPEQVTVGFPTISPPDAGIAPDGTNTATRITMVATTAGQDTGLRQDTSHSGTGSISLYVKGWNGTSGTTGFCTFDGAAWHCSDVAFVGSTWTRIVRENQTVSTYWLFGNVGFRSGNAYSASDVLVWGPQMEDGPTVTSFIDNQASASGSRAGDIASASITVPHAWQAFQATYVAPSTVPIGGSPNGGPFQLFLGTGDYVQSWFPSGPKQRCNFRFGGNDNNVTSSNNLTSSAVNSLSCFWDGTHWGSTVNGATNQNSTQILPTTGAATLYIGSALSNGAQLNGVVKLFSLTSTQETRTAWVDDSIALVSNAYSDYGTDTNRAVDGLGVSGATFENHVGDGRNWCQQQWSGGAQPWDTRAVAECGINDIQLYAAAGHALFTSEKTWVEARAAQGIIIAWLNIMPYKGSSLYTAQGNTDRLAFNSDFSTYCLSPAANVTCVDANQAMWNPADHDQLNPAYDSGDHLHPNSTGGAALATAVAAVFP